MTAKSDAAHARFNASLRDRADKVRKRKVGRKPYSDTGKLPAWYIRPDGSKP